MPVVTIVNHILGLFFAKDRMESVYLIAFAAALSLKLVRLAGVLAQVALGFVII